ncbi:hypothetical protein BN3590_02154 [Clostridium sp. C105KSO15]|nr:hypothetical protein BN3590_02154 [Clostridium sp. C105KSO15]
MFKIRQLTLFSIQEQQFTYQFSEGINYFKGKNDSGKTEFYSFIDFMFGSSLDISKKRWYKDSLHKATMELEYNDIGFLLTRTMNPNQNYFSYVNEDISESIDLRTYKDKLNSMFCQDESLLKEIRNFTNEDLTYRTFTMFNFFGENGQGKIQDFLDKCSDIKYSVKLNPILNFIFNNHLDKIFALQQELNELSSQLKELEVSRQRYDFIINQVNSNLLKLGGSITYTGRNAEDIKKFISSIREMQHPDNKGDKRNIADLEVMYNNISEQIKVHENSISDAKQFEKDSNSRKKLLSKLQELVSDNTEFDYLISPMQKLIEDIDSTIFFSNYIITDNTVKELRKQLEQIKIEIRRNDSKFKCYTVEQKVKSIALIEDYLSVVITNNEEDLNNLRRRIKEIKEEIKVLQNSDDMKKINEMSRFVTDLYCAAKDISTVVSDDIHQTGFEIKYLKKGNILQPMVLSDDTENINSNKKVNFYIGSMARHTLIQLCGYLSFMNLMLSNGKYPLVPILVIDHISKPFDEKNSKAIGLVLDEAYKLIGKENMQTFIFDDEDNEKLNINPDHVEDLVTDEKTGFNPFYFPTNTED